MMVENYKNPDIESHSNFNHITDLAKSYYYYCQFFFVHIKAYLMRCLFARDLSRGGREREREGFKKEVIYISIQRKTPGTDKNKTESTKWKQKHYICLHLMLSPLSLIPRPSQDF